MGKILEFENVYLELPETQELEKNESLEDVKLSEEIKQQKMSLEELQRKLEETQSLHL